MQNKTNNQWIKEMLSQYHHWQEKWYGKKEQVKSPKGQPVMHNEQYCQQAMDYCRKKFKECDKYGKEADACREHYLKKYKEYKMQCDKGKPKVGKETPQVGKKKPQCDKETPQCDKAPPKGGQCKNECNQTYHCLVKILQEVSDKYKKCR